MLVKKANELKHNMGQELRVKKLAGQAKKASGSS